MDLDGGLKMQIDINDRGLRFLAESDHYVLKCFYESAELFSKGNKQHITSVGNFYGDPEGGMIDWNERFCVTFGCGYIVYYIREPFESFMYDRKTSQWIEAGNNPDNVDWIKSVRQISDNEIEITDEDNITKIITIPL